MVVLYIGIQFLVFFPVGFLLLGQRMKSIPFVLKIPVFLSLGMVAVDILMALIGIFYIGNLVFPMIGIISYILVMIKFIQHGQIRRQKEFPRIALPGLPSLVTILAIILVIAHFSTAAGVIGWPPAGDLAGHGLLTSLLIHNGKLQSNLAPIEPDFPWHVPFGLHILSANLSLTFGVFPAISLFVLGTTIVILILLLIYSTVYILTRSTIFAVLALVSGFAISSIGNTEYWLLGYYYNGPYPNLFGYLALLLYVTFQFAVPSLNNYNKSRKIPTPSIVSLIGILLIYPPLAILPIIHLAAVNIYTRRVTMRKLFSSVGVSHLIERESLKAVLTIGLVSFFILVIVSFLDIFPGLQYLKNDITSTSSVILTSLDRTERLSFFYSLDFSTFVSNEVGQLTILVMIAAITSLFKRKFVYLSSFYLLISGMVILSSWELTEDYLWFILPRRLFVFLGVLNWIVLLTYLSSLISWLIASMKVVAEGKRKTVSINLIRYGSFLAIIIPITLILLPSLISHFTLQQAERHGWFPRTETFRNDYEMMVWIHHNIGSKDLIMVDNSFTSRFINSLSLKNITVHPISTSDPHEIQRFIQNQISWERPELLNQFIRNHDIKYVLLLSGPLEYRPSSLGGEGKFQIKKYSNSDYHRLFDDMSILEPVKEYGNATIYEVK